MTTYQERQLSNLTKTQEKYQHQHWPIWWCNSENVATILTCSSETMMIWLIMIGSSVPQESSNLLTEFCPSLKNSITEFLFSHKWLILWTSWKYILTTKESSISDLMEAPKLNKEGKECRCLTRKTLSMMSFCSVQELEVLDSIFSQLILSFFLTQIGTLKWIFKLRIELTELAKRRK